MTMHGKQNKFFLKNYILLVIGLVSIVSSGVVFSEEVTINQPQIISENNLTYENKTLIIDGANVTINGRHHFENLKIINHSVVTHDNEKYIDLTIDNVLEITYSSIDVSVKGLLADMLAGPNSGGSHAGIGDAPNGVFSGFAYGDYQEPITAGKGGRNASLFVDDSTSTRGGGVVKITAKILQLTGSSILANGSDYTPNMGGSAGGSIWINVENFITTDYSTISVMGGRDGIGYYSGGAGGRISIAYNEALLNEYNPYYWNPFQNLNLNANSGNYGSSGGSGTIFLKDKTSQQQRLLVINTYGYDTTYTPVNNLPSGTELITRSSNAQLANTLADLNVRQGDRSKLIFSQSVVVNQLQDAQEILNNRCLNVEFKQDVNFTVSLPCGTTSVNGNLTVANDELVLNRTDLLLTKNHIFKVIQLNNYSNIKTFLNLANTSSQFILQSDSLSIDQSSSINVDGNGIAVQSDYPMGMSHGGLGGGNNDYGIVPPDTYGEYDAPASVGKGVNCRNMWNNDCGGGALKIVTKELTLNGSISASSSTGSGGSVWLDVENIASFSGNVRADSSNHYYYHSGGGRVAVYYKELNGLSISDHISAFGFDPGTVYLKKKDSNEPGTLVVKNDTDITNQTFENIVVKYPQDNFVFENGKLNVFGVSDFNEHSAIKNAAVNIMSSVSVNALPIMENTTLNFQNDATFNVNFVGGSTPGLTLGVGGVLTVPNNNLIVDGYTLAFSRSQTFNDIEIKNYGAIATSLSSDGIANSFILTAQNISVDGTSKIDASGVGLKQGAYSLSGGSYGGVGGLYPGNLAPNDIYGSVEFPMDAGTGGANTRGGGALKIIANHLTLDGEIVSNGQSAFGENSGGAGGSVLLDIGVLGSSTGAGKVNAKGGAGGSVWRYYSNVGTGGGGGGRIAIHYDSIENFNINNLNASGGSSTYRSGSAGTIYLNNKTNPSDHQLRIVGSGIGGNSTMSALSSIPAATPLYIINAGIQVIGNLNVENVFMAGSSIDISGTLNVGVLQMDNSSISVQGADGITQGTIYLNNNSVLNFNRHVTLNGVTVVTNSVVNFYTDAEIATTYFADSVVNFYGNAKFTSDYVSVYDSRISVSGNLESQAVIAFGANNTFVNIVPFNQQGYRQLSESGSVAEFANESEYYSNDTIWFNAVPALNGREGVSFESSNHPGVYLRNINSRLLVSKEDQSPAFVDEVSFKVAAGKADSSMSSFESVSAPGSFIREKNGELWVEPISTASDMNDATWSVMHGSERVTDFSKKSLISVNGNAKLLNNLFGGNAFSAQVSVRGQLTALNDDLILNGIGVSLAHNHNFRDIVLVNNAILTIPDTNQISSMTGLELIARNVVIDGNSKIDLSNKINNYNYPQLVGGSHGGKGGNYNGQVAKAPYGDLKQPVTTGQNGGESSYYWSQHIFGGGAFKLTANLLLIDGAILANGARAQDTTGGAAGGSIWINAETISSPSATGQIRANGGNSLSVTSGGAGGGGRIALYYQSLDIGDENITVNGGVNRISPSGNGADGTIYREVASVPPYIVFTDLLPLVNQPIGSISVKFSAPINSATFTNDDISLIDANQNVYIPASISAVNEMEYAITFSPALTSGTYTLKIGPNIEGQNGLLLDQNKNLIGGEDGDAFNSNFTIDTISPAPLVLDSYPFSTAYGRYTFTGTKEPNSAILFNGTVVVAANANTTWAVAVDLQGGLNTFDFTSKDQAGNYSLPTTVSIVYDNVPPGPITNLVVADNTSGRAVTVDWGSYDVAANGNDIFYYKVYLSTSNYTSTAQATQVATINANQKWARLTGLTKGQTYYISVVGYDLGGLSLDTVSPIQVTTVDTQGPLGLSDLKVIPGADNLALSWRPANNADGDLASYRISYTDNGQPKTITLNQNVVGNALPVTYNLTGLTPATAYNIRVSAVDDIGNTSAGLTDPGVTLLPNPANLNVTTSSNTVALRWPTVEPYALVKQYAIYLELAPFTSVQGLTAKRIVYDFYHSPVLSDTMTGLTNGTKVYVAVTTINNSGGEVKTVQSIAATPQADTEGPAITEALYLTDGQSQSLASSPTLIASGKAALKATDEHRVSRINFALDNEPMSSVLITNAYDAYEQALDLLSISDGAHTLSVDAYDNLENVTHKTYSLVVDLAAPAAPVITTPAQASMVNKNSTLLTGTSIPGTKVSIANNNTEIASDVAVDSNGKFTTTINLQEGLNKLTAKAQYVGRSKWSLDSAVRNVTVNTRIPNSPTGLTALSGKQGQVFLNWNMVASADVNNQVKGYNLYRSPQNFSSIADAGVVKINSQLLTGISFTDLVVQDGNYFYAVSTVNQVGNESNVSATVSALADSQGPKIVQLAYVTDGKKDPVSGRMGPGTVHVTATFSEPLRNNPYFAIVPDKGVPIAVELTKNYSDEKQYTGQFQIANTTPSGTAYAVMSAYDGVGNRGTDIDQGATIIIDTQGPDVTSLILTPAEPLKVDAVNGLVVNVSIKLNDETNHGDMPKLVPLLNGAIVAGYEQGITLAHDSNSTIGNPVWAGSFTLPNSAARSAQAVLSFNYLAEDDLNNASSKIAGKNQFQVYQGDLPPLATPSELIAKAQPGGKVKLNWKAVDKAISYVLYRQGPNDASLIALDPVPGNEFIDQTPVDGTYLYAVASIRNDNGQESRSAKSETVSVKADHISPTAPQQLALELNGAGVVARWVAPALDVQGNPQLQEGVTYNLYRTALANGQQVTDLTGLTPIQTRIPALIALDTKPSTTEHSYVVTAVDAAGNESAPSSTLYLNFGLLPVNQLQIALDNNGYPTLTWQHNGVGIKSYRVSRHTGNEPAVLLTPEGIKHLATTTSYVDTTYNSNQVSRGANQEVVYSVVAVDANNVESLPHELTLPALSVNVEKTKDITLDRGVMNQVMFRINNKGKTGASRLRLSVTLTENGTARLHHSEYFDVTAEASVLVPVIIGGYSKLDGIADLTLSLEQQPQANEAIKITELETVLVGNSSLSTSIQTQDFTRGAQGKASFSITNTSDVETEIVLANNNGNANSTEVRLVLEDLQGNVLAQQPVKQFTGGVINISSGQMVARIAPNASFTSAQFTMNVPQAAPDRVKLRLVVDKYHYHLGQDTHVEIAGVGTSKDVQLSETPYYAEIDSVTPAVVYAAGDSVTITGRVINRSTSQPMASVPITLVYTVRGFERKSTVYADATGKFVFVYKSDGTSGKYVVSAIHPDVTDRPNQGQFIVEGGSVNPQDVDLKIPRNYVQKIPVRINAGYDSTLNNVRLALLANTANETAQLPAGITISADTIAQINPTASTSLIINFSGDNNATDTGLVSYRVEADNHTGANALSIVNLHYNLQQAAPAVVTTPTYIDTGVGLEQEVTENLVITNKGLDVLRNASIELATKDASALPAWIMLATAPSLGDIAIGETRAIQLTAKPDANTPEGNYEFTLQVKGDNLSTYSLPVFVKVTQSGKGKAFFHVSDIYTATLDKNNQRIDGVGSATINLQNENVLSDVFTLNTDAKGETTFENIPAGRYSYRVSAFDHTSVTGRIWIKPSVTTSQEVFLMNNLVNIEWSVREITVEDRYEVKLDATFKAQVPVALVMISPLNVQLPVMKRGEVYQGEFTLTNHGLIRAENMQQVLPANNAYVRFEFLKELPSTLLPGEVFVLPYKVQAITDFNPEADAQATGGGCGDFNAPYTVNYQSRCVNETVAPGQAQANFNSNWGGSSCGGSNTGYTGTGGGWLGIQYGGSSGGGGWVNHSGTQISDDPLWCIVQPECDSCNDNDGSGAGGGH